MTLQNFEKHQPDHELKKGHDYFRTGHVNRLKETAPGEWEARVRGRETYEVAIVLEGNEIADVDCDCILETPYCKHVLAVLYALQERLGLPAPRAGQSGMEKTVTGTARIVKMDPAKTGARPTNTGAPPTPGTGQSIPQNKEEARDLLDEAYDELEIGQPGNDYASLADYFPQELLDLYADKLSDYAEDNIGNESYAVIIRTLKKMQGWSGGAAFVKDLAGELIKANRRRPPLVDALKKFL